MNFACAEQLQEVTTNAHPYKCTEVAMNTPSAMIFRDISEYTFCFHNFTKSQACPDKDGSY